MPQNLLHTKQIRYLVIDKPGNHASAVRPGIRPVVLGVKPDIERHHINSRVVGRNT